MARIKLEDYGIWYDEETELVFDEDGECRSNVPNGTFPYQGKLYTYGTKVKISNKYPYNKSNADIIYVTLSLMIDTITYERFIRIHYSRTSAYVR